MDIKAFATNAKKENEGVWVPGPDGAEFLIARLGNDHFKKLSTELAKPHRRLLQLGKLDEKVVQEITAEVTARTILLGWKNVKEGGKPVEYSPETAKRWLLAYKDFAEFVSSVAGTQAVYQDELDEAAAGN